MAWKHTATQEDEHMCMKHPEAFTPLHPFFLFTSFQSVCGLKYTKFSPRDGYIPTGSGSVRKKNGATLNQITIYLNTV